MKDIALYVPSYNAERTLGLCLEGALGQTYKGLREVIVVDDGSTDGTAEVASTFSVRLIRHGENRGLAAARNTGVASAKCDLVASLDADCVPESTWLERLAQEIKDGDYAAVGGRLVETVVRGLPDRWRGTHMRQDWGSEPVVNPPFMFGNNVVLKRRIYETIGGCDVRFRTHGEDADLSRRLYAAGHSTLYVPSAVVRHLRTDTMRSLLNSVWSGWRYGSMAYFNLAPPAVLRTGVSHFVGRHFTRVLSRDIRAANVPFLLFDSILPWYMLYRDLRLILRVLLKKEAGRA